MNLVSTLSTSIQAFVPDPDKSQSSASMTGNVTFGNGVTYGINTTGWSAIKVRPVTGSSYYYNSDPSKLAPLDADVWEIIWVGQAGVESGVIQFGTPCSTNAVQGM